MTIPAVYPRSTLPRGPARNAPDGLPLFGWVARGAVARSGQPTTVGFRWLQEMGFRAVVSLCAEGDGDRLIADHETRLILMRLPWVDEAAPTVEGAEAWLKIASNPEYWPLAVHCRGGRGRSSCAAAMLRHTLDGWPFDLIMEEVRLYRLWLRGLVHVPLAAVQRDWLKEYCK